MSPGCTFKTVSFHTLHSYVGDLYFARARQILADIEEAEAEVTKSRGSPRGHLHVNTSNGFGVHELAPALPDFLMRYPDIEVELSITDRIVDLVADHAI